MMFRPTPQCSLVKFLEERKMKFSVGCFAKMSAHSTGAKWVCFHFDWRVPNL
jgi:hypothetical protein